LQASERARLLIQTGGEEGDGCPGWREASDDDSDCEQGGEEEGDAGGGEVGADGGAALAAVMEALGVGGAHTSQERPSMAAVSSLLEAAAEPAAAGAVEPAEPDAGSSTGAASDEASPSSRRARGRQCRRSGSGAQDTSSEDMAPNYSY
jgi:hypothetical protein